MTLSTISTFSLALILTATGMFGVGSDFEVLSQTEAQAATGGFWGTTCYDYYTCHCHGLAFDQGRCFCGRPQQRNCWVCSNVQSMMRQCYYTIFGGCTTGTVACGREVRGVCEPGDSTCYLEEPVSFGADCATGPFCW